MEILNREAKFNYFIEEEYECGIVLVGTELKSACVYGCNGLWNISETVPFSITRPAYITTT